jgi:oxalate decarboxylase
LKANRKNKEILTRREMIGAASLAGLGAAMLPGTRLTAQERTEYRVGKDPGKHEPVPSFKFDIESTEGWVGEAGTAKEATVAEFPPSTNIAGVSMRLKPGGIRELHWHALAAEWAFVVKGTIRTTVMSPDGHAATDDFEPGDIWYFPKGHGHALQNISNEDSHFVLGFDDGHFSEFGTFSITDWLGHTPASVLSRNLGLSTGALAGLAKKERYIIPGKIPPALPAPYLADDIETPQTPHKFRLGKTPPMNFPGGWERLASVKEFPINKTLTSVLQHLERGAIREMHWHPNADEWQYYLSGRSRVTVFGAHGRVRTEEFGPGQICFIQQGFGHFVEQMGSEPTELFALFNSPTFEEISISKWLAGNPASLIADNLGIGNDEVQRLPKRALGIIR